MRNVVDHSVTIPFEEEHVATCPNSDGRAVRFVLVFNWLCFRKRVMTSRP